MARREIAPHIEVFFNRFLRSTIELRMPPGYSSIASTKMLIEQKFALRSQQLTCDKLEELGIAWGARGRGGTAAGGFGAISATPDAPLGAG